MKRIFISHSTKDESLVQNFIDFLLLGMGIARNQIFCTSKQSLESGKDYIRRIKEELETGGAIVAIITENYLNSISCMMELGAAWVLSEKNAFFPILVAPVTFEKMNETFLKGYQMLRMDSKDNMTHFYDECYDMELIEKGNRNTVEFNRRVEKLCKSAKSGVNEKDCILKEDEDGYCETEIAAVRNVPDTYRCYRIKGRLWQKEYLEDESHWLFYHTGVFPDLAVGDKVRFKVSKTEIRQFPDLKNARNIYPAALIKEEK